MSVSNLDFVGGLILIETLVNLEPRFCRSVDPDRDSRQCRTLDIATQIQSFLNFLFMSILEDGGKIFPSGMSNLFFSILLFLFLLEPLYSFIYLFLHNKIDEKGFVFSTESMNISG